MVDVDTPSTLAAPALSAPLSVDPKVRVGTLPNGIRYYVRKRGAGHRYEIEIQPDAQTYWIRCEASLKKSGGPGADKALHADMLYTLACADIEELVGMDE